MNQKKSIFECELPSFADYTLVQVQQLANNKVYLQGRVAGTNRYSFVRIENDELVSKLSKCGSLFMTLTLIENLLCKLEPKVRAFRRFTIEGSEIYWEDSIEL